MKQIGVLLGALLTGCATTTGIAPIFNETGATHTDAKAGPLKAFYDAEQSSFNDRPDPHLAYLFFSAGHDLVKASCISFFESSGETQKWVFVSRDVVAAAGAAGAALLAINGASTDTIARVALGTALTTTGIDIYTRHFLFSAENIAAVKQLTFDALAAHAQVVAGLSDQLSYSSAAALLRDNQYQCSYSSIRKLAVDAIAAGRIKPASDPNLSPGAQQQDEAVLVELGHELRPPGVLTADEAFALYWLLMDVVAKDDQEPNCERLAGLAGDNNPCKDKKYFAGWQKEKTVREILKKFSPSTQNGFKAKAKAEREARAKAPNQKSTPSLLKSLPRNATVPQSIRIEVLRQQ